MRTPKRVLIVDDEPHIRTYIRMLVADTFSAAEFSEAADESSALAEYAAHRPDLVLLDINLVGSSGLSVLQSIRHRDQDCVIVMISAINVRHTIETAMQEGADGYIIKDAGEEAIAADFRAILEECSREEKT